MQSSNFKAEIATLLANKNLPGVKARLANWLPADSAPILSELPIKQLAALFRGCSKQLAAAVFSYLEHPAKRKLLKTLTQPQAAELLNALPPDDRTAFLNERPLDYLAVYPDWTVLESLNYIRTHGYDRETLNMVYVTGLIIYFSVAFFILRGAML